VSETDLTVTHKIHFSMRNKGKREVRPGPKPVPDLATTGRVPRVARLMALAIRFDELIRSGAIADRADLARLGHVSRARVTQIMNLLHLAPDIQEELLFLPRVTSGRDPIAEPDLRAVVRLPAWDKQRRLWRKLRNSTNRQNSA
jgi:hypothetical protein